ncbi:MAG: CoA transferase [Burkholderiales bacterium]|nr:MAG: CoA transferase [Burkholderiales bacterium]
MAGPLQDLKVLELGQLIAGPFAGKTFAEFGADLIKIEPPSQPGRPGGDPLRYWRQLHEGTSLWWHVQSRNKKSVTVNLREPEGQDIVRRLALEADIVIENFRPGTLEKWGLGYEQLARDNPGLIMVRISGFGQTGPMRDQAGFGSIGESMGGMRYVTGYPDRPPVRMNLSIGDAIASLHAVIGALMALHHRQRSGRGQVVDVALYEAVFNMMESVLPEYDLAGLVRERTGSNLTGIVPSNTYPSGDGTHIVIGANGDSIFRRLCQAMGRDDWLEDRSLQTNDGRATRAAELDAGIAAWTSSLSADEALARLGQAQVPSARIYSIADIVSDPQYLARDMIRRVRLEDGTELRVPGIVPKLSATPGEVRGPGPRLGEHTGETLAAMGFSAEEIARMRAAGIV